MAITVFGLLVLRLMQGPIALDDYIPQIHKAIQKAAPHTTVQFKNPKLVWGGVSNLMEVVVDDLSIAYDKNLNQSAKAQQLALRFEWHYLLISQLRIKSLRLISPDIAMKGELALDPSTSSDVSLFAWLPSGSKPRFKELIIEHGRLSLQTLGMKNPLVVNDVDLDLYRKRFGLHLHANVHLEAATISTQIDHLMWQETSDFELNIKNLTPSLVARLDPDLLQHIAAAGGPPAEAWSHMTTPVTVAAKLKLKADGLPDSGEIQLALAPGKIFIPGLMTEAIPLQGARGSAHIMQNRLEIKEFSLTVPRGQASAFGYINWNPESKSADIHIEAKGKDIALDDLRFLWPGKLAPTPWAWVTTNIKGGSAPFATLSLKGQSSILEQGIDFKISDLKGDIGISNATVKYMQGMPIVTQVNGIAHYDPANFNIDVASGKTLGLTLKPSKVLISKMDQEDQDIHLELNVEGPIRDALEVIDSPALQYAKMLGLNPADVSGNSISKTILDFPLGTAVTPSQVHVDTRAKMQNFFIKNPVASLPYDFSEGSLNLHVNNQGLDVVGKGSYNNTPIDLKWTRFFSNQVPKQNQLIIHTHLGSEALKRFNIEGDYIKSGEAPLTLTLIEDPKQYATFEFKADLTPTQLELLGWNKPTQEPARASVIMNLSKREFDGIRHMEVNHHGRSIIEGKGLYDPRTKKWQGMSFNHMQFGPNDFQMTLIQQNHHLKLLISGDSLDIQQLLQEQDNSQSSSKALAIDANIQKLKVSSDGMLHAARVQAFYDGQRVKQLQFAARLKESKEHILQLSIEASEQGRTLNFYTNNAGAVLRAFDILNNIASGEAVITASNDDKKEDSAWKGRIVCRGFRILQAPLISHLLTLASPTTILNILRSKEGIEMSVYRSKFNLNDRLLELRKGRGHGSSLGFTLAGQINRLSKKLSLHGTIIPAYDLNTLISKIPLIGTFITGGKHEGLWAVNYEIMGNSAAPKVSVNPLSALTPGIIRRIFDLNASNQNPNDEDDGEAHDESDEKLIPLQQP